MTQDFNHVLQQIWAFFSTVDKLESSHTLASVWYSYGRENESISKGSQEDNTKGENEWIWGWELSRYLLDLAGSATQSPIVNHFLHQLSLKPISQGFKLSKKLCHQQKLWQPIKSYWCCLMLFLFLILLKCDSWMFFCSVWKWCLIAELLDDWKLQVQPTLPACNPAQPLLFCTFSLQPFLLFHFYF